MRDPRKCCRIFFVRCPVEEAYSMSYVSSVPRETPQTHSVEEAPGSPVGLLSACMGINGQGYKKTKLSEKNNDDGTILWDKPKK